MEEAKQAFADDDDISGKKAPANYLEVKVLF